jgi:uncharacterized membrane protein YidH (DUF202 family)
VAYLALDQPAEHRGRMTFEDSASVRDLLASHRTLLAWVRTAMAFAGLGFAVARFGLRPGQGPVSAYLGVVLIVVAMLMMTIGYLQHRQLLSEEMTPPGAPTPARWPGVVVTVCCLLACGMMIPYLLIVAA